MRLPLIRDRWARSIILPSRDDALRWVSISSFEYSSVSSSHFSRNSHLTAILFQRSIPSEQGWHFHGNLDTIFLPCCTSCPPWSSFSPLIKMLSQTMANVRKKAKNHVREVIRNSNLSHWNLWPGMWTNLSATCFLLLSFFDPASCFFSLVPFSFVCCQIVKYVSVDLPPTIWLTGSSASINWPEWKPSR